MRKVAYFLCIFGSYARGDFQPDSDVDLLLLFPTNIAINKETKQVMEIAYEFMLADDYLLMPTLTTNARRRLFVDAYFDD